MKESMREIGRKKERERKRGRKRVGREKKDKSIMPCGAL